MRHAARHTRGVAPDIQILTMSAAALVDRLDDGEVDFVHLDPPWPYRDEGHRGGTGRHYEVSPMGRILNDIDATHRVAKDDTYLACWATFPTVWEFAEAWWSCPPDWQHLSGGTWGKVPGRGVGRHLIGDAEPYLVFRKGSPRPRCKVLPSNLVRGEYSEHPRDGHSEKPQEALIRLIKLATKRGDLVLDLYAGDNASMARACHTTGRRYIGAEIDPQRAAKARRILRTFTKD